MELWVYIYRVFINADLIGDIMKTTIQDEVNNLVKAIKKNKYPPMLYALNAVEVRWNMGLMTSPLGLVYGEIVCLQLIKSLLCKKSRI